MGSLDKQTGSMRSPEKSQRKSREVGSRLKYTEVYHSTSNYGNLVQDLPPEFRQGTTGSQEKSNRSQENARKSIEVNGS